jgi:predicted AAA+ superfamily ATPase
LGSAGLWPRLFATKDRDWRDLLAADSAPEEDWRELARRGGYPTPAVELSQPEERALWFAGYARTYLERDLQDLSAVGSLIDFRRLMRVACLRLGNLVNQTEISRDVGLSQPTVHRHLDLLETSYQLVRLPAYAVNRTKRLLKAPKLYWCDTGLALHLAGESEPRGAHLENLILSDLLAWRDATVDAPDLLYWRTTGGDEVDFVIEWKGELLPIEIKATAQPGMADARSLRVFREEYSDRSRAGLLLHAGNELGWLADGVLAAPWWKVI